MSSIDFIEARQRKRENWEERKGGEEEAEEEHPGIAATMDHSPSPSLPPPPPAPGIYGCGVSIPNWEVINLTLLKLGVGMGIAGVICSPRVSQADETNSRPPLLPSTRLVCGMYNQQTLRPVTNLPPQSNTSLRGGASTSSSSLTYVTGHLWIHEYPTCPNGWRGSQRSLPFLSATIGETNEIVSGTQAGGVLHLLDKVTIDQAHVV